MVEKFYIGTGEINELECIEAEDKNIAIVKWAKKHNHDDIKDVFYSVDKGDISVMDESDYKIVLKYKQYYYKDLLDLNNIKKLIDFVGTDKKLDKNILKKLEPIINIIKSDINWKNFEINTNKFKDNEKTICIDYKIDSITYSLRFNKSKTKGYNACGLISYSPSVIDEKFELFLSKNKIEPDYKKAYNILMDYFNFIPDEDKAKVSKELKKVGL